MWGAKLRALPGFEEAVTTALERIGEIGMYEAMREVQA